MRMYFNVFIVIACYYILVGQKLTSGTLGVNIILLFPLLPNQSSVNQVIGSLKGMGACECQGMGSSLMAHGQISMTVMKTLASKQQRRKLRGYIKRLNILQYI